MLITEKRPRETPEQEKSSGQREKIKKEKKEIRRPMKPSDNTKQDCQMKHPSKPIAEADRWTDGWTDGQPTNISDLPTDVDDNTQQRQHQKQRQRLTDANIDVDDDDGDEDEGEDEERPGDESTTACYREPSK